jgi:hypothetical protein
MSSARPPSIAVVVTGPRTGPAGDVRARSAATAAATLGPVTLVAVPPAVPLLGVTTMMAGAGACGNAWPIASMVWTAGRLRGASMAGSPSRIPVAGTASASSAITATPPQATGRAATARASAPHTRDGRAAARLRPRNGMRPASAFGPSHDSSAGRTVSEPMTAIPITAIVATAMAWNSAAPPRNSPAIAAITVRPETKIVRPDVRAAIRSASSFDRPRARSSRSRRR